ncbi:uncharacterized protein LOC114155623 [Xiphophorus couchianus]|uniref:uncharacterized protein LOC114155623 n=1 Tax=Xiphophorus couchianus TaxID=32473 RepID=UPI001015FDB4|nr:uncharacterized protein LOC114155623 [Xiphophorus couchianus]
MLRLRVWFWLDWFSCQLLGQQSEAISSFFFTGSSKLEAPPARLKFSLKLSVSGSSKTNQNHPEPRIVVMLDFLKTGGLTVILLLGSPQASGVQVLEGADSVVLPCSSRFPDVDRDLVVWIREDLNPSTVHLHSQRGEDLQNQNQRYRGRTSMEEDALRTGDLSLSLTRPTLTDSSIYTCTINRVGGNSTRTQVPLEVLREVGVPVWLTVLLVLLTVTAAAIAGLLLRLKKLLKNVQQVEVKSGAESVLLPCISIDSFPEDSLVEWTDSRGRQVHVYQSGSDRPEEQHWVYTDRTQIRKRLKKGVLLCLMLRHPMERDSGTFTCTVFSRTSAVLLEKKVELQVKVPQVEVDSGVESVLLPCRAPSPLPVDAVVEWSYHRVWTRKVHLYQSGSDRPEEQCPSYRARTEMNQNPLISGDLSLTLRYPTDGDSRTFTCSVHSRDGDILLRKQVHLQVKDCEVLVDQGADSVKLPFRTLGVPPGTEVEWSRTEPEPLLTVHRVGLDWPENQNQLYRDRTETGSEVGDLSLILKNPTERDSGTYICRVQTRDIKRTKTITLRVSGSSQGPAVDISGTSNEHCPLLDRPTS